MAGDFSSRGDKTKHGIYSDEYTKKRRKEVVAFLRKRLCPGTDSKLKHYQIGIQELFKDSSLEDVQKALGDFCVEYEFCMKLLKKLKDEHLENDQTISNLLSSTRTDYNPF